MKRFLFLVLIFQNVFSQEIPLNVQKLIKAYPDQIVGYKDNKIIFNDKVNLTLGNRFDNHDKFGTHNSPRAYLVVQPNDAWTVKGGVAQGFRAPSLAQIYYNLRFTNFSSTGASEILLSPKNSPVTQAFGIGKLNENLVDH